MPSCISFVFSFQLVLLPLVCAVLLAGMNVVMPTAMMTMHEDPDLRAQSALTGSRGARVLEAIGNQIGENAQMVLDNCRAIYAVAAASEGDGSSVEAKEDLMKARYDCGCVATFLTAMRTQEHLPTACSHFRLPHRSTERNSSRGGATRNLKRRTSRKPWGRCWIGFSNKFW